MQNLHPSLFIEINNLNYIFLVGTNDENNNLRAVCKRTNNLIKHYRKDELQQVERVLNISKTLNSQSSLNAFVEEISILKQANSSIFEDELPQISKAICDNHFLPIHDQLTLLFILSKDHLIVKMNLIKHILKYAIIDNKSFMNYLGQIGNLFSDLLDNFSLNTLFLDEIPQILQIIGKIKISEKYKMELLCMIRAVPNYQRDKNKLTAEIR